VKRKTTGEKKKRKEQEETELGKKRGSPGSRPYSTTLAARAENKGALKEKDRDCKKIKQGIPTTKRRQKDINTTDRGLMKKGGISPDARGRSKKKGKNKTLPERESVAGLRKRGERAKNSEKSCAAPALVKPKRLTQKKKEEALREQVATKTTAEIS